MPSGRTTRGGLGGLGAIFFLGTLGAIAAYVQQKSADPALELPRTSATAIEAETPAVAPPPLPWENRLDLSAATLVAYGTQPGSGPEAATHNSKPTLADGRLVQELGDGHRILLTLDPVLQDAALQIFRNREVPYAAAVMLDLRDNSVLVLAGHSTMDPKVDPMEIVATAWAPAASVFKLVTTAALLDSKAANEDTRVCFSGGLHGISDDELRDDPARDTQCETLASAVAHSYNLVIGKLALAHLSQAELAEAARRFLFESEIPFELNVERSPAHIPSEPLERAKVAAGFWNIDMSPIHGAVLASVFARGGLVQPPHIIAGVLGPDGTDLTPAVPRAERIISRDIADSIGAMMVATTTRGTARASFRDNRGAPIEGLSAAGKTGSLTGKRAPALNYNWFVGYAPAERPEVAVAVVLANEPKWRIKAHYAARRMFQIYAERRDAIAMARDARLAADGLHLPQRDESGALLAQTPPSPAVASEASGATTPSDPPANPQGLTALPAPDTHDTGPVLPPVPGPVPAGNGA